MSSFKLKLPWSLCFANIQISTQADLQHSEVGQLNRMKRERF